MSLKEIYTPKQIEVSREILKKDRFMLILHGAKRSGKTILNNDLFLKELIRVRKIADKEGVDKPSYILAGASISTIYQNILIELLNRYGLEVKFDVYGNFTLFGVYVVQTGHSNIKGVSRIRGMTSYGAYINEASLAKEEVFNEIRTRCSGYGARVICDTNPDNPEHRLLKDYIKNPSENILSFKFTLFDNTFLNDRYVNNILETTPSGMFYERDIYGNRVSGDGVVYQDFDLNKHYIKSLEGLDFARYFVGVDRGYKHYGAMVVIGATYDDKFIVVEEIAEQLKEIDRRTDRAKEIKEKYGNIVFYCDSARTEHIDRLKREGIRAVLADKEVIPGIESVAKLYKTDRLFILEPAVKRFKEEIYSYIWDPAGKDDVKKENDDVMDAMRYALYSETKPKKKARTMPKALLGL